MKDCLDSSSGRVYGLNMMNLRATTKTITKATFEQTNTRGKARDFIQRYNNCIVRGFEKGGFRVFTTDYVISGSNGLRANGFMCERIVGNAFAGEYIVRRDPKVEVVA